MTTPIALHKVSHSEAESFLSCRRKHFYGYIKNGGLKPNVAAAALTRGSMLHGCLEAYYNVCLAAGDTSKAQRAAHKDAVAAALEHYEAEVKNGFDDTPTTGRRSVHEALFEFYFPNENLVRAGWIVQAVELKVAFEFDLFGDDSLYQYPFVVDLIALDPKGKTVVIDHKFIYDFYSPDDADLFTQLPKYVGALRAGEFTVDYAGYNMIRNRSKKDAKIEDVVRFMPVKPTTHQIENVISEQVMIATDIIGIRSLSEADADATAYRSASAITCRSCDFSDICRTERIGGDITPALAVDFTVKDPDKPFEADLTIN